MIVYADSPEGLGIIEIMFRKNRLKKKLLAEKSKATTKKFLEQSGDIAARQEAAKEALEIALEKAAGEESVQDEFPVGTAVAIGIAAVAAWFFTR